MMTAPAGFDYVRSILARSLGRRDRGVHRSGVAVRSVTGTVATLDEAEVVLLLGHDDLLAARRVLKLRQANLRQADLRQAERRQREALVARAASAAAISDSDDALGAGGDSALRARQSAVHTAVAGFGNTGQTQDESKSKAQRQFRHGRYHS